jgi:hypothetical protein
MIAPAKKGGSGKPITPINVLNKINWIIRGTDLKISKKAPKAILMGLLDSALTKPTNRPNKLPTTIATTEI